MFRLRGPPEPRARDLPDSLTDVGIQSFCYFRSFLVLGGERMVWKKRDSALPAYTDLPVHIKINVLIFVVNLFKPPSDHWPTEMFLGAWSSLSLALQDSDSNNQQHKHISDISIIVTTIDSNLTKEHWGYRSPWPYSRWTRQNHVLFLLFQRWRS